MIPHLSHDLSFQQGSETTAAPASPMPLSSSWTTRTHSTSWMPLEGIIQDWLDLGREATLATALAAAGAGLFALSHEKHALRCYSQGWHHCWHQAPTQARHAFQLTEQHLAMATQQWSLVGTLLDTLCGERSQAVPDDELDRIQALVRTAREQQARLHQLAAEVRTDLAAVTPQPPAARSLLPARHNHRTSRRRK